MLEHVYSIAGAAPIIYKRGRSPYNMLGMYSIHDRTGTTVRFLFFMYTHPTSPPTGPADNRFQHRFSGYLFT